MYSVHESLKVFKTLNSFFYFLLYWNKFLSASLFPPYNLSSFFKVNNEMFPFWYLKEERVWSLVLILNKLPEIHYMLLVSHRKKGTLKFSENVSALKFEIIAEKAVQVQILIVKKAYLRFLFIISID